MEPPTPPDSARNYDTPCLVPRHSASLHFRDDGTLPLALHTFSGCVAFVEHTLRCFFFLVVYYGYRLHWSIAYTVFLCGTFGFCIFFGLFMGIPGCVALVWFD